MEFKKTGPGRSDLSAAPGRELGVAPRVDAVVFSRKREEVRGTSALSALPRLVSAGVAPEGTLDWQVQGYTGRDEMQRMREFIRVQTRFSPWLTCSRCLEPVQIHDLVTDTRFRLAASENQADREDRESESVEVIAADPHMDLAALVEDEAMLALPMAPAHPHCKWDGAAGSDPQPDV